MINGKFVTPLHVQKMVLNELTLAAMHCPVAYTSGVRQASDMYGTDWLL